MKRLFSMAIALILALSCWSAFAEMNIAEPVSIEEQLSTLGISDLAAEDLIGEWHAFEVFDVMAPIGFDNYDPETFVTAMSLTIHEDGTGVIFHSISGEIPANVEIYTDDITSDPILKFVDPSGGYFICMVAGKEHEVLSNMESERACDYYIVTPMNDYYFYYTKEWESIEWPEANTDAAPADFDGKWTLTGGSVFDRKINYDLNYGQAFYTSIGTTLDIDTAAGAAEFASYRISTVYNLADFQSGVYTGEASHNSDLSFSASILSDGSLLACINEYWYLNFERDVETAEETTVAAEDENVEIVVETEEESIDPLTEYSDKATIKAVQAAMNDLGYECGTPDGISGKKTAAAVSSFQEANGLTITGSITHELIECLTALGFDI